MTTTILVAEDDRRIREGLIAALESEGYAVAAANDGDEALARFREQRPDLLLLDIMMPGRSGYDVCREIRRQDRRTPVLMLTAKGEEIDKVVGLELGADDYITKPFGLRELLARVAAALRRAGLGRNEDPRDEDVPDRLAFGTVEVDRRQFCLHAGGASTPLTAREMDLLCFFRSHPDEALDRNKLLNAVWGVDYLGTTRTLDQHIAQLRKKIEPDPHHPQTLLTVHGVGYRYTPEGVRASHPTH